MHNLSLRQAVFISSFIGKKNHLPEGHHSPCCQPCGEETNNRRKDPNKCRVSDNFINFRIKGLFFKNAWQTPTCEHALLDQAEPTPWLIHLCLELASVPLTLTISLPVKPECQQLGNWLLLGSPSPVSDHTSFRRLPSHSKGSIKNKWNTFSLDIWVMGVLWFGQRSVYLKKREMPLAPAQTGQAYMSRAAVCKHIQPRTQKDKDTRDRLSCHYLNIWLYYL